MASLADRLALLSPEKRALLLRALESKSQADPRPDARIPVREDPAQPAPLSFAQQRLWFLDQLEGGATATYNMPIAVRLQGRLDRSALRDALQSVVDRHAALRTRFVEEGGAARQHTASDVVLELENLPLGDGDREQREMALSRQMAREAATPFNLSTGPLIRAKLAELSPVEHVLLITVHHIVSDGWSIGRVFLQEFTEVFDARVAGRDPALPVLALQYPDYAAWQVQQLQDARLQPLDDYWRKQLENLPPLLELPTDRPRPVTQTHRGAVQRFCVPKDLVDRLKQLGTERGATLFMVLLAGFACLLGRYSRQSDFAIGSPVAGRSRKELESLIGLFVNSLVLRMRPNPDMSVADWIDTVRGICLGAFGHQDMPFERLVEILSPQRTTSFSPLFQVMFILQNQNVQRAGLRSGGVEMLDIPVDAASAMFDLTLKLEEQAGELLGELEYSTDLFDSASMQDMTRYLQVVWETMVASPQAAIGDIALLSSHETAADVRLLRSDRWPAASAGVCERILEQARRTPSATAVSDAHGNLSYQELLDQSLALAGSLVAAGLGSEMRVGICLQRRSYLLPSLLGVMLSGCAYVPIDPEYPRERVASMIEQGQLALLITDRGSQGNLPETAIPTWYADARSESRVAEAGASLPRLLPDQLAYVIFTSGSTGRPKGVQITHGALANFLLSMERAPGLVATDRLAAITTVSFDIAGLELFLPLLVGATVELIDRDVAADGYALLGCLQQSAATVMQATPSTWRMLLATGAGTLPIRKALCGGEALDSALAGALLDAGVELWNLYGPTETTIWSSLGQVRSAPVDLSSASDLGQPVNATALYILDERLHPCVKGIPGELYIGGFGVSRGYAEQPGLTAERFIPDPFSEIPGTRMYRTGDLVVRRHSGRVEYIGRADFQVKLRGYRIELGEVESVLTAHPAISQSVAVTRHVGAGEQLVAYAQTVIGWQDTLPHAVDPKDSWQLVWDETYRGAESAASDDDFSGWLSSVDGRPMDRLAMCRWADATAEQVLSFTPKRLLEIGCGTGIIAHRLAPHVEHYVGVDFSAEALSKAERRLRQGGDDNFTLLQAAADTVPLAGLGSIDTVVINSVAQYFPSLDYLLEVLARLAPVLEKGARIFLGDIRHLGLLDLFHTWVTACSTAAGATVGATRDRIRESVAAERELLFSPAAFSGLTFEGRPAAAFLSLKSDGLDRELRDFRFDLCLTLDAQTSDPQIVPAALPRLSAGEGDGVASLDEARRSHPRGFWISALANPRLQSLAALRASLCQLPDDAPLPPIPHPRGLRDAGAADTPTPYLTWAREHRMKMALGWDHADPTRLQALVVPESSTVDCSGFPLVDLPAQDALTNRLARRGLEGALIQALLSDLRARLPSFMVPATIVLMEQLPLTPNGKIDRAALPSPEYSARRDEFVAPSTELERQICAIWSEILGVPTVGVRDNFFQLGGHSLLAVRVIARIRALLGRDIPLQCLFDSPTVAELALDLGAAGDAASALPLISPCGAEQRPCAPLTQQQRQLWFLDQLNGPSATYHISCVVAVSGDLRLDTLKASIEHILSRHDVLRTHFQVVDGEPKAMLSELPSLDWRFVEAADGEREQGAISDALNTPFNLESGPLFRCHVIARGHERHVLVLVVHHIVADEWSLGLMQQELADCYPRILRGDPAAVASLPLQYADYAHWRQSMAASETLQGQLAAWKASLAGAPEVLQLPTDRPRPVRLSESGALHRETLSAELAGSLRSFSASAGVTLFMTLLSGWAILLGRRARTDDLVIGVPVSDRGQAELESLVGFFVNTLPLRIDLSGQPSVSTLLERVKTRTLAMLSQRSVSFEQIIDAVKPARSLSHTPIYQAVFVLQNAPKADLAFGGLDLELMPFDSGVAKFDVTLSVEETERGLDCVLEYSTDLFDEATILDMMSELRQVWWAMGETPERGVHDLPLMAASLQERVLMSANPQRETSVVVDEDPLFHWRSRLLESPASCAVEAGGESLSRRGLDTWSDAIAMDLRDRGVGCGDVVGLHTRPSLGMVAAVLAVLKTGAAYLPLMPDTPRGRLEAMLAQTQCDLVIDEAGGFPLATVTVVDLLPPDSADRETAANYPRPVSAAPACIIFTSGSTGEPKAVAITYGNLSASLNARLTHYPEAMSGLLLLQPFNFDVATGSILWALASGGCLFIEPPVTSRDPELLLRRVEDTRVSHLILLPLQYSSMLAIASREQCAALRCVIVGGEQMPGDLPRQHLSVAPGAHLYNEYGPTEATVMCAANAVDPKLGLLRQPIGRAMGENRLYVLDDRLSPVAFGVTGELCVGGPQVAAGYLGKPSATGAAFVPDPFSRQAGARLYRSGDLARVYRSGVVELLGRDDRQIKIRGHRIELGEIESAVIKVTSLADVAVIASAVGDSRQLVAYLGGETADRWSPAALRDALSHILPAYMLPQQTVVLRALPRNANGKIDLQALSSISSQELSPASVPLERSAVEAKLAAIWCEVLGRSHVNNDDNFFALGGDSILCIQVVSRARQAGLNLSVAQLFDAQSIAELAPLIHAGDAEVTEPLEEPDDFEATPIQQWFLGRYGASPHHFNQSLLLRIDAALGDSRLRDALAILQRVHPMLNVRVKRDTETQWRLNYRDGATPIALETIDLPAESAGDLQSHAARAQAGLNIFSGPLCRALRFRMGSAEDRLLLVVHHMAVDGVSWRIIVEDLQRILSADGDFTPATSHSFAQWSQALAGYQVPASSVDYWLSVPEPTTLPLDSAADPAVVNVHGAECTDSFPVPETLAAALLGSVPVDLYSGIQDLLLTALHASLSRWTGESRLGVSLEGHGRQSLPSGLDVSRTVGWFTAAYPVVFEADVDCGLLQRLRAVRDQRQRIPADGFEFGLLRYRHKDSAIRQRLEAVERQPVCFNYLGQFHQGSAGGGILGEAAEGVGREHGLSGTRPHLIDINGYFSEGQLRFFWTYNPALHAPSTIERLALGMVDALADLVDLALRPLADTPYAPSDFPLVDLRWRDCDALFAAAGAQVSNLYPLSRMQQGMLFHSQVAQEGGAYVVQYACSISGVLCADRFHAAWQAVVQRHEALRTCVLPRDDDDPLQIVLEHVQLPWCEQDWRGIDADTQNAQWGALLDTDRTQGFAVQSAPMMRCQLVRLGDDRWKFLWSQHHIVSDGWSLPIILADVLREYHRLEHRGMAPSPAPKLLPYVRWFQGQDHQTARDYWSGYLADLKGPTRLGWSQSDEHQGLFAARHAQLCAAASSALYRFARDRNTTINRLVELAIAVVIAAWTDRQEIVFGATVSGRPAELVDVEGTVGMFINSVPVRLRWSSADTSFNDLLLQLQEHYGQRLAHEYLPFIEINELANLGARQQMFDFLCVFENFPVDESLTGSQQDFKVGDVSVIEQTNFPATLSVQPGDEISMTLSLSCDWFEPGAGDWLLGSLVDILSTLPDLADKAVSDPGITPLTRLGDELGRARPGRPDLLVPERAAVSHDYSEPATDTERVIAGTFAAVLQVSQVGRDDDFFDLGGHSLLAGRVASRLSLHWGVEVPISCMFENSSVASLACFIDNQHWAQTEVGELARDEEEFVF